MKLKRSPKLPNLKILAICLTFLLSVFAFNYSAANVNAATVTRESALECTDLKFVFARGSGVEIGSSRDYAPFASAVESIFGKTNLSYSFYELGSLAGGWGGNSYPAPGIGIATWQRFTTSLGALFSGGEANDYGESVEEGADEAMTYLLQLRSHCGEKTKVILAGYSQGAQVVSRTLQKIDRSPSLVYSALTFGDPKLHLPEGKKNLFTQRTRACSEGKSSYSVYRAYVPDCYTYEGILGGYDPYQTTSAYDGKLKAYCQWRDVICSSYIDLDDLAYGHASYDEQGTFTRAVKDVYNQLASDGVFGADSETFDHPVQNVALLFDNTDSMSYLFSRYQVEATKVAKRVFESGDKVALYTYGDLEDDKNTPHELCSFSTCTADNIEDFINSITLAGGGDEPESLLSSSLSVMKRLTWDAGANKSIVVLTDAPYHDPDHDKTTLEDVKKLAADLDPVNFYILTTALQAKNYDSLAGATDGKVYVSTLEDAFSLIETDITSHETPTNYAYAEPSTFTSSVVSSLSAEKTSSSSAKVSFNSSASKFILTLNDYILGFTEKTEFTLTDLDFSTAQILCVSPVSADGFRDASVCVNLSGANDAEDELADGSSTDTPTETSKSSNAAIIPKAPNAGAR